MRARHLGLALSACIVFGVGLMPSQGSAGEVSSQKATRLGSHNERPLLARELVLDTRQEGYRFTIWIDPNLSKAPRLVRKLRQANMPVRQNEPCADRGRCYLAYKADALAFRGRLISGIGLSKRYYGGAHASYDYATILYDTKVGSVIGFSDLFANWQGAKAILQEQWCIAIKAHSTCPPVEHQVLALVEDADDGINRIRVQTDPYAFETYGEGADSADLRVTEALLPFIKPQFRGAFRP